MDWGYMSELMVSMFIFTPGLIIFGALLLVGLGMIMEKAGLFDALQRPEPVLATDGAEFRPGEIVSSLKQAVREDAAGTEHEAERETGT